MLPEWLTLCALLVDLPVMWNHVPPKPEAGAEGGAVQNGCQEEPRTAPRYWLSTLVPCQAPLSVCPQGMSCRVSFSVLVTPLLGDITAPLVLWVLDRRIKSRMDADLMGLPDGSENLRMCG